ncbi:MAG: MFS transporter [Betaproteobacteria bacterium]|nr:MFS transporter [Betaproteobacteria bacterium]
MGACELNAPHRTLPIKQLLLCGAAIVVLTMGVRHGFGLWLQPITQAHGWLREDFSLAIAVQNLVWGLAGIFSGMLADRFGAFRIIAGFAVIYALGLVGMGFTDTPLMFSLSAGVLIGIAQAGTTYSVIYGVLGRNIPADRRAWAMGVTASAGSFGQFALMPLESWLIQTVGWQLALVWLGAAMLLVVPLAFGLREPQISRSGSGQPQQTIVEALREAFGYRSFQLLMAGYFVCGFQVMFIGVHIPSYVKDHGLDPQVASFALALIGLFNIFGTYTAGSLAQRLPKHKILSGIYFARALGISAFLLAPPSPASVYLFAGYMGFLWLSTVPVTTASVAQIFGVAHLSMLGGFIFFSHQVGSFIGVWLGGWLHDQTGNYDLAWYLAILLGVLAGLVNLPVNESPIRRTRAATA